MPSAHFSDVFSPQMSSSGPFLQSQPRLGNQFLEDSALQAVLARLVPTELFASRILPDLVRFGQRTVSDVWQLSIQAERSPPVHVPFDAFGHRIDTIETSAAWKALKAVSAEEGLVALGYDRQSFGKYARVFQFAKLYLFTCASAIYSCPLAMTDGAARLIESLQLGDQREAADVARTVLPHLLSRHPSEFWTSGQWMTERPGGSDVSKTETVYDPATRTVSGFKWFTSATDSEMAMILARDPSAASQLSLFFLNISENRSKIVVHRLKEKLGTRALPTAELTLNQVPAVRLGQPGHGVKEITRMINLTRIYNAVSSISLERRMLAVARDYAGRRVAFGRKLLDQPLHKRTLALLEVQHRASLHLTFFCVSLLGRTEADPSDQEAELLLRVLTPVAKLYTAKKAIEVVSEALECVGGVGYCEDSHLPRFARDVQVLSIWEGTTNVLSLDLLRAMKGLSLQEVLSSFLVRSGSPRHGQYGAVLEKMCRSVGEWSHRVVEADARDFAFAVAEFVCSVLLAEQATAGGKTDQRLHAAAMNIWMSMKSRTTGLAVEPMRVSEEDVDLLSRDCDVGGIARGIGDGAGRCRL